MVSVENRFSYIERVIESPKIKAFHYFLLNKDVSSLANELIDLDELFYRIIFAIQSNNKGVFNEIYTKKSKSNPNKESPLPFVNDDYLIFCLIVGVSKFGLNYTWLRNIISIRNRNDITITFENLLNENYLSTNNLTEVVLLYLNFSKQSLINDSLLNAAFISITENTTLLSNQSDFQILCSFRAYDIVIVHKEAVEGNEITLLRNFNEKFNSRIKIFSWLLQSIVLLALIYCLFKLPIYAPETVVIIDKFNYIFTFVGATGLTLLGNQVPFIKEKSHQLLSRLFGYPKKLIKNL